MNSAAVIGRQLRQHQTTAGRTTSGSLAPPSPHRGRPRTPSHQPHHQQLPSPPVVQSTSQPHQQQQQQQKEKGEMKSCVSFGCIWLCCKALSGGMLLIAIGVGMTVFGFYADSLAVHERVDEATNQTIAIVNEDLRYHIHNFTYVGPVFMGLGGMLIVAACVLVFDNPEDDPTRGPLPKARRPSDAEGVLTEQLIKEHPCNGPISPFISLGPPPRARDKGGTTEEILTVVEVVSHPLATASIPNGPSQQRVRPRLPLEEETTNKGPPPRTEPAKRGPHLLSPLFDEFVPSPQDIQILDPDGCTPGSTSTFEMDAFEPLPFAKKCQRLQLPPRYLASVESDGLSDSDDNDQDRTVEVPLKGRFCSPLEGQDVPLLGRCSPPSSPEYPLEPLLKRERVSGGLRRFQLMRQVPHRTLFDGPSSSEGGSR